MNESNLHNYQRAAVEHIVNNPFCGLFLEMGLGKTVSTLTAINYLKNCYLEITHVLVVAPLRVAQSTWSAECEVWEHLHDFRISKVLGTPKQRGKALKEEADLYIINRENIPWLVSKYQYLFANGFFDMLVLDELSSFKCSKTARWKALRMVRPYVNRVVGLTGTPAPNGYEDLWPEVYLLDQGQRLGPTLGKYRREYFTEGARNGNIVYKYNLKKECESKINSQISDICISMKAEDYLELPDAIYNDINVNLGDELIRQYKDFEKKSVLSLIESSKEDIISAASAASLTNKLLQYSNGAVYDDEHYVHFIHDKKLDALEDIVEAANGSPVLVFYSYRHDIDRIIKRFKGYRVRQLLAEQDIVDWNNGEIDIALAHPAGAGHGLNLQHGGHIIAWFGLTWSLELYQQANARLHRQGQTCPVTIYHLMCDKTIDSRILKALTTKEESQNVLMDAVKYLINQYR